MLLIVSLNILVRSVRGERMKLCGPYFSLSLDSLAHTYASFFGRFFKEKRHNRHFLKNFILWKVSADERIDERYEPSFVGMANIPSENRSAINGHHARKHGHFFHRQSSFLTTCGYRPAVPGFFHTNRRSFIHSPFSSFSLIIISFIKPSHIYSYFLLN